MNPLTKFLAFLALTFVFVVLYGHGFSGFASGVAADGRDFASTATHVIGGTVELVTNYFYPEEPPPPPPAQVNPSLKAMLDKTPNAIEKPVDLRSSTYIPTPKPKPVNPHQQPISIDR